MPLSAVVPEYWLRMEGLRPMDELAVRVFLQRCAEQLRGRWSLDSPPGQAPTVPHLLLKAASEAAETAARLTVWVARQNTPVPAHCQPILRQPLQMEEFVQALQQAEARLQSSVAPAPSQSSLPSATLSASATRTVDTTVVYRLNRWPTAGWLNAQRHHVRLATLLISRSMTLEQLVALSQSPASTCRAALDSLQAAGWLDVTTQAATPMSAMKRPATGKPGATGIPAATSATSRSGQTASSSSAGIGLIQRLRQRWGL